ncbi:MAG TPA: AbrB/MazE/SpoVT family DNA-binding domain-containing protein [Silvibacterium sp.]|jgi:antitoxin VapB|nr:AbrB/MazE/SpoVT family DNA-binding domain-containing protein [Silvibacterium sp.]
MVYTKEVAPVASTETKTAKLFRNGRSQAVRLPAEFRFEGKEVLIRKDPETGDVILSEPNKPKSWDEFFARVAEAKAEAPEEFEDFMKDRKKSPPKVRDLF